MESNVERLNQLKSVMGDSMCLKDMEVYVFGRAVLAMEAHRSHGRADGTHARLLRLELCLRKPRENEYVSSSIGSGRIVYVCSEYGSDGSDGSVWKACVQFGGRKRHVTLAWNGKWESELFAEPGEIAVGTVVLNGLSEGYVVCEAAGLYVVQVLSGQVHCRLKHVRDVRVDQRGGVWQVSSL
tara:strand:- start:1550 stop:2098 length:549 start_codon:yes stop_codon:yes gene_type:complete